MITGKLEITSKGIVTDIKLDGEQLICCTKYTLRQSSNNRLPTLVLEIELDSIAIQMDKVSVDIRHNQARNLLVKAGWTPPKED